MRAPQMTGQQRTGQQDKLAVASIIISILAALAAVGSAAFAWRANQIAEDANSPDIRVTTYPLYGRDLEMQGCSGSSGKELIAHARSDVTTSNLGGRPVSVVGMQVFDAERYFAYNIVAAYENGKRLTFP